MVEYLSFEENIGNKVKIKGKIAKEIWQHLVLSVKEHPFMEYIDLDEDHQIVVYSKGKIECEGNFEMIGELLKAKGESKNPRAKIHDDIYFEYQLIVETWKCSKG
ncbi:MAG: hypothetical protein KGD61_00115 [Candidatus Lokiarchaeota archaeon]|nr:hypothetical protein [Candidatus Lokiarchaeota archaeon]